MHIKTIHKEHLVVLIVVQDLVRIDAAVFDSMVFMFCVVGMKTSIHASKIGVLVDMTLNGQHDTQKGTCLRKNISHSV